MRSARYEKVKSYFEQGFWNMEMVRNAVIKGWITKEEFKKITGVEYE